MKILIIEKEKIGKEYMTWMYYYHIGMVVLLTIIGVFTELIPDNRKDTNEEQIKEIKDNKVLIEVILIFVILFAVIMAVVIIAIVALAKENVIVIWFSRIVSIVYLYWAIKQILKMIFVPENRAFSKSDIRDFVVSYFIGVMLMLLSRETIMKIIESGMYEEPYKDIVSVVVMLIWLYFNVLFVFGGIYVLLYYLWSLLKKVDKSTTILKKKCRTLFNKIYSIRSGDAENIRRMKCIDIWEKDVKLCLKIFCSLPLFLYDAMFIIYAFIKDSIILILLALIAIVLDPIVCIRKLIKKIWNMYPNNEWMYIIAQVAGLISYIIVFVVIQYGKYGEDLRNIYEFLGTIILIPYFLGKILKAKKQ